MAYQTRQREPLLDSDTAAAIERRSKELIGLGLLALGALTAAMIWSYSPDDPNWMVSTDRPVQNWLGRTGASIAGMLFTIVGWGAASLALILAGWGVRLVLHLGADRVIGRLIFGPIWVAAFAIYAATLHPGSEWLQTHSFGLGGLFGDMVMGAILTILPLGSALSVKLMSLLMALSIIVFGAFVLGFTRAELWRILRWLLVGLVMAYAGTRAALGRAASAVAGGLRSALTGLAHWRARQGEAEDDIDHRAAEMTEADFARIEAPRTGFLSRMPSLIRRSTPSDQEMPVSELVEYDDIDIDVSEPDEGRVRARIADAIRARIRTQSEGAGPGSAGHADQSLRKSVELPPEPPLTRHRAQLPPEPPLTGGRQQPQPGIDAFDNDDDFDDDDAGLPIEDVPQRQAIPAAQPTRVVEQAPRKKAQPSTRAQAEAQPNLFDDKSQDFDLPPLNLLTDPATIQRHHLSSEALEENARMLEAVLDDYGVKGDIVAIRPGPVVTMYELEPAPGLKASRVIGLADDIARSMAALSARVSTVPGRSVIGIELPNENRERVVLREILAGREYGDSNQSLPLALGKDIGGDAMVANLAKMPHLLIAGTTGSGKSVAINTMILSLLYRLTPDQCRLIMIDPKMLELSVYDGIPHLLSPVVTDPKKAVVALKWVVGEMEERYRKMSKMGVRNIDGYNARVKDALRKGEMFSRTVQTGFDDDTGEPVFETEEIEPKSLPYIVVIVDEMADLMMVAGKEIEACIQRLAQMARASGIHLIMATQRPSVDVITGTIKANFPTRISFQVTSKIDSRTILGEMGAEQLLGMGDMLYMAGGAKITRCHAPFVSDEEVEEIVNHLKGYGPPDYVGGVVEGPADEKADGIDAILGLGTGGNTDGEDALYDQAVGIVIKDRKCSTSYIQRKLAIGYNKAARLVEQMEDEGVVSQANHVGKREILVPEQ